MAGEAGGTRPARRVGRPADPGIDERVTEAAMALIAESGWRGLTFDSVATRAGVAARLCIGGTQRLAGLMLAVMDSFYVEAPVPDTGTCVAT